MIKPNSQTHKVLIRSNKANQIHHEISLSKSPFTNRSKIEWGLHTTPEIWSSRESDRNTQLKWSHKNLKPHQIQQSKENPRSDQAKKHPKAKFRKKKKKKKNLTGGQSGDVGCHHLRRFPPIIPTLVRIQLLLLPRIETRKTTHLPHTQKKKTAPNLSKTCPWIPEVYTKNPLKNMHQNGEASPQKTTTMNPSWEGRRR